MNRRTFLGAAVAASVGAAPAKPVIDSHIHLYDVTRPQGVPWPPKDSSIYKKSLPDRYRKLATPHGVVGAIAIECSPWFADNQWVLDVAQKDSIIVGMIGNLIPGTPEFRKQLEGLRKNKLFLGIRCGNLWDRDLGKELSKPAFIADLKLLAAAGLVLDTANPTPELMSAIVHLTDRVPELRVVLDHLPSLPALNDSNLRLLAQRPKVFAKFSGIVQRIGERVPLDVSFYRHHLDGIWELFGPDRLIFGSDWPNSEQLASYDEVFQLAQAYLSLKDAASSEKVFWKNSVKAYRWIQRDASQPRA